MGDLLEKEIVFRLHMYEDEELIDLVEEYTLTAIYPKLVIISLVLGFCLVLIEKTLRTERYMR